MKAIFMMSILLVTSSIMAEEKGKSYYVKKNGKYYKVKKVSKTKRSKKIKKKATSTNSGLVSTATMSKSNSSESRNEGNIVVAAGVTINGSSEESSESSSTSTTSSRSNTENTGFNYGLDLEIGYKFQVSERVNITPGLFVRRKSYTSEFKKEIGSNYSNASATTTDLGAVANIGYDFHMESGNILRPTFILGYSSGSLKAEAKISTIDVEANVDYKTTQFGFGLQGIMSSGFAPFGKIMISSMNMDDVTFSAKNSANGASASSTEKVSGDSDTERTLILGLGYWF